MTPLIISILSPFISVITLFFFLRRLTKYNGKHWYDDPKEDYPHYDTDIIGRNQTLDEIGNIIEKNVKMGLYSSGSTYGIGNTMKYEETVDDHIVHRPTVEELNVMNQSQNEKDAKAEVARTFKEQQAIDEQDC